MASIIIQRLDGTTYDLDEIGLRVISFDPPGPNYQYTWTQMSQYSAVVTDVQLQQSTIPLVLQVRAHDIYDYELKRLKLLKVLAGYEPFYVINSRIPWLRWKVVPEAYDYLRLSNFWYTQPVTINLTCADSAAETVLSTLDDGFLDAFNGANAVTLPAYIFTNQKSFTVWNGSTMPLRAEEHPALISIDTDAADVTLTNTTTGQKWTAKGPFKKGHPVMLYGLKATVDNKSIYANTNHAYIDLVPGDNKFTIVYGSGSCTVSVKTHFYF
jgi:hypothetical protein